MQFFLSIALWLGHEQVETTYRVYLHADLSLKQRKYSEVL